MCVYNTLSEKHVHTNNIRENERFTYMETHTGRKFKYLPLNTHNHL